MIVAGSRARGPVQSRVRDVAVRGVLPVRPQGTLRDLDRTKQHQSSFGATSSSERLELAELLRSTLRSLDEALDLPDFNYVLHTAPIADEGEPYYLWHLQILPRITTLAGFELGSGIPINTVFPERAAAELRETIEVE